MIGWFEKLMQGGNGICAKDVYAANIAKNQIRINSAADPVPAQAIITGWSYPLKGEGDAIIRLTNMAKAKGGYFPVGSNGMWHGGVHFDLNTMSDLDDLSVRCIADGEVVAYRIDDDFPTTKFMCNQIQMECPFSTGFVLVRHRMQAPDIKSEAGPAPALTFFSLYMHLESWSHYCQNKEAVRPAFWTKSETYTVGAKAKDIAPGNSGILGVKLLNSATRREVLGFVPQGTELKLTGTGAVRKVIDRKGPQTLLDAEGQVRGYVAAKHLLDIGNGEYRVNTTQSLIVRDEESYIASPIGKLPPGTEVVVSGQGDYRKLERINQYVALSALQSEVEPRRKNAVVVLEEGVSIKAADLIGHIGLYQDCLNERAENKFHLEVFTAEDVQEFFVNCRAWGRLLPAEQKNWLKLVEGTPIVIHKDSFSQNTPPSLHHPFQLSGGKLLIPKTLLDALPKERKIVLAPTQQRPVRHWFRLEGLLHDSESNPVDGWVCDEVGITPWVSPWSWEGYEVIHSLGRPQTFLASFLRATGALDEHQLKRFGKLADSADRDKLFGRLHKIIDKKITARAIQAALQMPAKAQAISQLVISMGSDWKHEPQRWDVLDELLGHSGGTPHVNWQAEKTRIKKLSWWSEVAEHVGLPAHGHVAHLHPLGMIGNFKSYTEDISVDFLERVLGKSGDWFTGMSGGARFSEKFEREFPRIYKYDKQLFVFELNAALARYAIQSRYQKAHFISQCFHESAGFDTTVEYSSGERYDPGRHADAMVNGNTEVGDGPRYKGRGLIQLTWKNNYLAYSQYKGVDFVGDPNAVALNMSTAIDVSCWYWRKRGGVYKKYNARGDINIIIDNEPLNVELVSLAVNGGRNGLKERFEVFNKIAKEWGLV